MVALSMGNLTGSVTVSGASDKCDTNETTRKSQKEKNTPEVVLCRETTATLDGCPAHHRSSGTFAVSIAAQHRQGCRLLLSAAQGCSYNTPEGPVRVLCVCMGRHPRCLSPTGTWAATEPMYRTLYDYVYHVCCAATCQHVCEVHERIRTCFVWSRAARRRAATLMKKINTQRRVPAAATTVDLLTRTMPRSTTINCKKRVYHQRSLRQSAHTQAIATVRACVLLGATIDD
jgi:hypothetical protein